MVRVVSLTAEPTLAIAGGSGDDAAVAADMAIPMPARETHRDDECA